MRYLFRLVPPTPWPGAGDRSSLLRARTTDRKFVRNSPHSRCRPNRFQQAGIRRLRPGSRSADLLLGPVASLRERGQPPEQWANGCGLRSGCALEVRSPVRSPENFLAGAHPRHGMGACSAAQRATRRAKRRPTRALADSFRRAEDGPHKSSRAARGCQDDSPASARNMAAAELTAAPGCGALRVKAAKRPGRRESMPSRSGEAERDGPSTEDKRGPGESGGRAQEGGSRDSLPSRARLWSTKRPGGQGRKRPYMTRASPRVHRGPGRRGGPVNRGGEELRAD